MSLKKIIINVLILIFVSIITFLIISFLFDKNNSPSDGNDAFGWPLVYYTYLGGHRIIEPEIRAYFNQTYLIIDILFSILISFGILSLIKIIISSIKK